MIVHLLKRLPQIAAMIFLLVSVLLVLPFVTDSLGITAPIETKAGVLFPRVPISPYMADHNWTCPPGYNLSQKFERNSGDRESTRWWECVNDGYNNPQIPALNWTEYCTGNDPVNPWQWWRYSDDLGSRIVEYVRPGDGTCVAQNWSYYCTDGHGGANAWQYRRWADTNGDGVSDIDEFVAPAGQGNGCMVQSWGASYCTGGNDANGNYWQMWQCDNSSPSMCRKVEDGNSTNGCLPPKPLALSGDGQCTYTSSSDTFVGSLQWKSPDPAVYNTYELVISGVINDTNYTQNSFSSDRAFSANTTYSWSLRTKSALGNIYSDPVVGSFSCPLPSPRTPSGTVTCDGKTKTAELHPSAKYATSYDIELKNKYTNAVIVLDNISSPYTQSNLDWADYTWRVRGVNTYQGKEQNGNWSSDMDFSCLPPPPDLTFGAVNTLIKHDTGASLYWRLEADYDMRCTITGSGENYTITHTPPVTERTAASPYTTKPLGNATIFTLSCWPQIPALAHPPAATKDVRVDVVPKPEET